MYHFCQLTPQRLACRWVIPSNIPVAALGGQSLFGAFTQSIGKELSHFPTGPALGDKFWCVKLLRCMHGSHYVHETAEQHARSRPYVTSAAIDCRLYLVTWHVGLFLAMFLGQVHFTDWTSSHFGERATKPLHLGWYSAAWGGDVDCVSMHLQIGVQGRKQGYFD